MSSAVVIANIRQDDQARSVGKTVVTRRMAGCEVLYHIRDLRSLNKTARQ
jgi:uncharacterized protein involved in tolerance to divalent cations